ncbi:MAG: hypothetical protein AAF664_18855, partial [Planctomycetota bacterium]
MNAFILCFLQVSLILLITTILVQWALHREPAIAARVGVLGLALAVMNVVLNYVDVPRPISILSFANKQTAEVAPENSVWNDSLRATETQDRDTDEGGQANARGVAIVDWLSSLTQLRRMDSFDYRVG